VVFDPNDPCKLYAGNDGGVYRGRYTSASSLGAWTKASNGLAITMFNDVGTSPDATVVGGGSQDNGTSWTTGGRTWGMDLGFDGGCFVVDPDDPHIQYMEQQNGVIFKRTDS